MDMMKASNRQNRKDILERAEYLLREKKFENSSGIFSNCLDHQVNTDRYEDQHAPPPFKRYPNIKIIQHRESSSESEETSEDDYSEPETENHVSRLLSSICLDVKTLIFCLTVDC